MNNKVTISLNEYKELLLKSKENITPIEKILLERIVDFIKESASWEKNYYDKYEITFKNSNGEYETDFPQIILYNQLAKNLCEYCHKGDLIAIRGMIQTGSYEKDGNKIYTQEIIADKVTFLATSTRKSTIQKEDTKAVSNVESNIDPFAEFGHEVVLTDDDLPF